MFLLRLLLKLRYRILIEGKTSLPPSGQPLFLFCSYTSQLDPLLIASALDRKVLFCQPKDSITVPWLSKLYRKIGWTPLPSRERSRGAFALRRYRRSLEKIQSVKNRGCATLFFPQGFVQLQEPAASVDNANLEEIAQTDGVQIAYAQVRGMLGSLFSSRSFGGAPAGRLSIVQISRILLRSLLLFLPRREIIVEFSSEPLFQKENKPRWIPHDGQEKQPFGRLEEKELSARREQVFAKLSQLSGKKPHQIHPDQNLYEDLMLDSLDVTELTVWTREVFNRYVPFERLQTAQDILDAIERYNPPERAEIHEKRQAAWMRERKSAHAPKEPEGTTILEAFFAVCERMGSEIACADPADFMSYKRLKSAVVGMAEPLRKLQGDRIGILLNNSIQFNVLYLALLLAGKTPALLNWTLGSKHLREAAIGARLGAIITTEPFLEHLKLDLGDLEEKVILFEEIMHNLSAQEKQNSLEIARKRGAAVLLHFRRFANPDEPAVLAFTSGTEGLPKTVPLTHRNLLANHRAVFKMLDLTQKDAIYGVLPAFHVFGFSFGNLFPLLLGCRAIYMPNILDFEKTLELAKIWKATLIATTPTFLSALCNLATNQLQSVRLFVTGAEKTPDALFEKVENLPQKPAMIEGYGTTECSPCLTLNPVKGKREGVGPPLPGVELLIADQETLQVLAQGQSGLVLASGENVFKGYLHQNKQPFVHLKGKERYNTGDLGYLNENGSLILQGRLSRTVKIGGELVHLQAIETILQTAFPQSTLAVVSKESEGKALLILYSTQPIELDEANLCLKNAGLSNLLRVHDVKFLQEMPRLGSGKIDYKRLG